MRSNLRGKSVILRFLAAASNLPRPLPPRAVDKRLVLFSGVLVYGGVLSVAAKLLNDPDTFWHISLGQKILTTGHVPSLDTFSYTMMGATYHSMEWLSQVLMSVSYRIGGYAALTALTASAAALAFAILYHELKRRLNWMAALLLCAAFLLSTPHILCRPHVLVSPIVVLWTACLIRSAERGRSPSLMLLPLMTLWANMHGSFLLGLALTVPFSIEAVLRTDERRATLALKWAGFGLLALAAACVSPYGIEQITAALHVFDLGDSVNWIDEWQPQNFGKVGPFELVLLFGLAAALLSGIVVPLTRVAVLVGLLHMALSHNRHTDLFAMLSVLVLAEPIARRFHETDQRPVSNSWVGYVVPALGTVAAIVLTAFTFRNHALRPPDSIRPEAAVAAARAAGIQGRVLNDYNFGGYLIFIGEPTFIDGRGEFFGKDRLDAYMRTIGSADADTLARFLDENRIAWTLLRPERLAARTLDHLPGWRRVYADDNAVVHTRCSQPPQRADGYQ
jgi:hypothetical protein